MNEALLSVVGLGPGREDCLTPQVRHALERAETIVGYAPYVRSIPQALLSGKQVITWAMRDEMARCRAAIQSAAGGARTVLVCSGDPGVYALAGLVLELTEQLGLPDLPVDVLPGIPAVCAAAALLGAPLTHDFACVSLSDLLTPWDVIERRVRAAVEADFVLALYNPRSRNRNWQLERVLQIVEERGGPDRICGLVRQAGRPGQTIWTGTLRDVQPQAVDMLCIVLVGNSETRLIGPRMVTPRGYLAAYDADGQSSLNREEGSHDA